MAAAKRVSDVDLVEAYRELRSVWKVGKRFGIGGQSVHERLAKIGANRPQNVFRPEEVERLKLEYLVYAQAGKLNELAEAMGRRKSFICRVARDLGLTKQQSKERPWLAKWKDMPQATARVMMDDFKSTNLGMGRFCKLRGYGEIGFWQTMTKWFPDEWEHVIESKAPSTSKYKLGRAFEYRVRDDLKRRGYFALRSPASKSPIDLLAVAAGRPVLFVQCKTSGALGVQEWNEIFDLAVSCGGIALLAERTGYRGLLYHRLTGRKDGSRRAQPYEEVTIEELTPAKEPASEPHTGARRTDTPAMTRGLRRPRSNGEVLGPAAASSFTPPALGVDQPTED